MKHCLVVDDSGSIRKIARRILDEYGFRTSEAETRAEALEICRAEMPDCVVGDWQMPEGDALAFLAKLRSLPGGNRPTNQANLVAPKKLEDGVWSGDYLAVAVAAAPFPVPIKFEGTFRLIPIGRTRSWWSRVGDFFAGCGSR